MEKPDDDLGLRTITEAATALRCSRRTVYRLHNEKKLKFVKVKRRTRVTAKSIEKLVKENSDPE